MQTEKIVNAYNIFKVSCFKARMPMRLTLFAFSFYVRVWNTMKSPPTLSQELVVLNTGDVGLGRLNEL